MEIYKFKTMTGVNREALYAAFQKLLYNEQMKHPSFDYDEYEWAIGGDVFARLRQPIDWYSYSDSDKIDKYLGIDLKVFSHRVMSTTISLSKKNSKGISPFKRYLNSIYGTKMFEMEDKMMDRIDAMRYVADDMISLSKTYNNMFKKDTPKKVIFNDPATIVYWKDGTKTVVKAEGESFDPEKGLAMAIAKKHLGNEGNYYNEFKKWLPEEETKWKDPAEKVCSTCKYFSIGPSSMSTCLDCLKGENLPNLEKKDEKLFGTNESKSNYNDIFREWLPKEETPEEQLIEKIGDSTHITYSFDILTANEFAELVNTSLATVISSCEVGLYPGARKVMGEWLIPYFKTSEV